MRKKVALSVAAAAMVGTLAVGGTLAWFTDTETATNVVTTGNVDIAWYENGDKITEENPGVHYGEETPIAPGAVLQKEAKVKNEGKNDALIRVRVDFSGVNEGFTDYLEPILDSENWLRGDDGYFYYNDIVGSGAETENFISSLHILESAGNEIADIEELPIELIAEAVQADNMPALEGKDAPYDLQTLEEAFNGVEITEYTQQ